MKKNNLWLIVGLVAAIVIFVLFFWKIILFFGIVGFVLYIAYRHLSAKKSKDEIDTKE
jgi:type IV secretory pathway TrbD component